MRAVLLLKIIFQYLKKWTVLGRYSFKLCRIFSKRILHIRWYNPHSNQEQTNHKWVTDRDYRIKQRSKQILLVSQKWDDLACRAVNPRTSMYVRTSHPPRITCKISSKEKMQFSTILIRSTIKLRKEDSENLKTLTLRYKEIIEL